MIRSDTISSTAAGDDLIDRLGEGITEHEANVALNNADTFKETFEYVVNFIRYEFNFDDINNHLM